MNATDQPGFPISFFPGINAAGPLGDTDGDGRLEIFIPGQIGGVDGVYAFDHAGTLLPGWSFAVEGPDIINQLFSTPVVVDLDGDARDEVLLVVETIRNVAARQAPAGTESEETLFAAEGSGQVRWQFTGAFEALAIPAMADLDGDGDLDIIVGTGTNLLRLEADGTPVEGWPAETLNDIHVSVPIVVDLDSDPANGREIILAIAHGDDPPVDPGTGFLNTFSVFAWHSDGTTVDGWPHHFLRNPDSGLVDDRVFSPGAAGDVDADGDVEVVINTYGQGDPINGNLFVFHHDGTLDANWPQWAGIAQTPSAHGGPALGDLDGDGHLEIVTGSIRGAYVFRADGRPFEGFPRLTDEVFTQPMLADLDHDGHIEIVEAALNDGIYVWRGVGPRDAVEPLAQPPPEPRPHRHP